MNHSFIASIFLVVVIEGFITWQYFNAIFSCRKSGSTAAITFILGYVVVFIFSLFDSMWVNQTVFLIVNVIILWLDVYKRQTRNGFWTA